MGRALMSKAAVEAIRGNLPFDILIKNVKIVNVFDSSIAPGCIGVVGERLAYVGKSLPDFRGRRAVDQGLERSRLC